MTNPYKPMSGRRLNCETTEAQSAGGKRGGLKKLDANQIEALWDATQAKVRATEARRSVVDGSLKTACEEARGVGGSTDKTICWPEARLFEQAPPPEPYPQMQKYVVAETAIEKSEWERIKHWFTRE